MVFIFNGRKEFLTRWFLNRYYLLFAIVHGIHLIELPDLRPAVRNSTDPLSARRRVLRVCINLHNAVGSIKDIEMKRSHHANMPGSSRDTSFYAWFIFFMAYLPRVLGKLPNAGGTFAEHVTLFGWVLIALILHLVIRFRKHNVVSA